MPQPNGEIPLPAAAVRIGGRWCRVATDPPIYPGHLCRGVTGDVYVAYYSRTGATRAVAERIAAAVPSARVVRFRPRREPSYAEWLLRSCVPGSRVPIEDAPTDLDW